MGVHRTGATWAQQSAKLTPSDETGAGQFGTSVALSTDGNTALIGGYLDNNGVGAAWAFTRAGAAWSQQGPKLTPSDESGQAKFGASVALSGDGNTALIGGPADVPFFGVGAAWIFTRAGSTWTQQGAKLFPTSSDFAFGPFGLSVALSADGNTALIGDPESGNREGHSSGSAWVFTRLGSTWAEQGGRLSPSDFDNSHSGVLFGASVALSADGNTALIGGPGDSSDAGAVWRLPARARRGPSRGRRCPPRTRPGNREGLASWRSPGMAARR